MASIRELETILAYPELLVVLRIYEASVLVRVDFSGEGRREKSQVDGRLDPIGIAKAYKRKCYIRYTL
jgi:hypothetical protein